MWHGTKFCVQMRPIFGQLSYFFLAYPLTFTQRCRITIQRSWKFNHLSKNDIWINRVLKNEILTDLLWKFPNLAPHWTQTLVPSHIYILSENNFFLRTHEIYFIKEHRKLFWEIREKWNIPRTSKIFCSPMATTFPTDVIPRTSTLDKIYPEIIFYSENLYSG